MIFFFINYGIRTLLPGEKFRGHKKKKTRKKKRKENTGAKDLKFCIEMGGKGMEYTV